ncbi:hypothetical protein [Staphylococcus warneri]|uniref:hypothetical protein n=1 Tax=Staphylococcus warneri TaxID=1292 RepID=UPI001F542377|nr:hypothetical protein [Staphylococcus warneri]
MNLELDFSLSSSEESTLTESVLPESFLLSDDLFDESLSDESLEESSLLPQAPKIKTDANSKANNFF